MSTTIAADALQSRREYQQYVASLLDEVEERRAAIHRRLARGVRLGGVRDLKRDLAETRARLSQTLRA